ncbi:Protein NCA1 [Coccomyxa sp. Obi]|nr:Protein NCA1 [Coccomyxa sp. Obi]
MNASSGSRCPFSGASVADVTKTATQGRCPFGFGPANSGTTSADGDGIPEGPVCPMGFGSAKRSRTAQSAVTCTRCDALFYDPVKTECQHYFCRACIQPCTDCLMCGADIGTLIPEPKLEELVDLFMELCGDVPAFEAAVAAKTAADSKSETPGEGRGVCANGTGENGNTVEGQPDMQRGSAHVSDKEAPAPLPVKDDAARADYLLECALRSMAGGNMTAAAARFGRCRDSIVRSAKAAGNFSWPEDTCCRLGDICGSQGVCEQRLGNLDAAEACFKNSIAFLEKCSASSAQVAHAFAVSHNKLGDLHFLRGDLVQARCSYRDALDIRQRTFDLQSKGGGNGADVLVTLSLVTSMLKVADIEEALGSHEAASQCLARSGDMLVSVSGSITPGSAVEAKHRSLQEFWLKSTAAVEARLKDLKLSK